MKYYSKIQNVFKRKNGNPNEITENFSNQYFELLKDCLWYGTEKLDGTNTCLYYDGNSLSIHGHREVSHFNNNLMKYFEKNLLTEELTEKCEELFGDKPMCIYGETVGWNLNPKISYDKQAAFYIFDVYAENSDKWLEKSNVFDIADNLGLKHVPVIDITTLGALVDKAKDPFDSLIDPGTRAEGIIATPLLEMKDGNGNRIITKLKYKDLKQLL